MINGRGSLATLAKEFIFVQTREISARLRIISQVRNTLSSLQNEEARILLEKFDTAVKRKMAFRKLVATFKPDLVELGVWDVCDERNEIIWTGYESMVKEWDSILAEEVKKNLIWQNWLCEVKGVNFRLAGEIIGIFQSALNKEASVLGRHFKSVSQMWAFAGLDVNDGKASRLRAGQKSTFNTLLRSILIGRLGQSLILARGEYAQYYRSQKAGLIRRCNRNNVKIVPTAKLPMKNVKHYEPEGIISKGHLDNMARRKMVKLFVSHFWEEARAVEGLPSGESYVFGVLKHSKQDYIPPIRDKAM